MCFEGKLMPREGTINEPNAGMAQAGLALDHLGRQCSGAGCGQLLISLADATGWVAFPLNLTRQA